MVAIATLSCTVCLFLFGPRGIALVRKRLHPGRGSGDNMNRRNRGSIIIFHVSYVFGYSTWYDVIYIVLHAFVVASRMR